MAEWISKAANVFKRDVPEAPQPFEVLCECGQKHTGVRRVRHQHLVCKDCGAALFVLPRDPYPPPHIVNRSEKKRKKRKPVSSASREIDLSPATVPSTDAPQEGATSPERGQQGGTRQSGEFVLEIERGPNFLVLAWLRFVDGIVGFATAFWDFWKPSRVIGLVIFCLLGLTVWYSIRQSKLRGAVKIVKAEFDAGVTAIGDKNWVGARQHFEVANENVNLLGRTDLEANLIRQYYRETTALTRLAPDALFEIVDDAEAYYVQFGPEKWQERFRLKYEGQWNVVEGYVRPTTNPRAVDDGYHFELIFPVVVGSRQRRVEVQLDFNLAPNLPIPSREVAYDAGDGAMSVFGAQLKECFLGPDGNWVVRYNADTSFFWVNRPTYEATNLHLGSIQPLEDQERMFDQQAKWMGVKE